MSHEASTETGIDSEDSYQKAMHVKESNVCKQLIKDDAVYIQVIDQSNKDTNSVQITEAESNCSADKDYLQVIDKYNEDRDYQQMIDEDYEDRDYLQVIGKNHEDGDYQQVIGEDHEDRDYLQVIGKDHEDRDYQQAIDEDNEDRDDIQVIGYGIKDNDYKKYGHRNDDFQASGTVGLQLTNHCKLGVITNYN